MFWNVSTLLLNVQFNILTNWFSFERHCYKIGMKTGKVITQLEKVFFVVSERFLKLLEASQFQIKKKITFSNFVILKKLC